MISNDTAANIVKEVIRRVAFQFPNAANGYAGLDFIIDALHRPKGVVDAILIAGRFLAPTGVTIDIYDNRIFKIQVTGTIASGSRTIGLSIGGDW